MKESKRFHTLPPPPFPQHPSLTVPVSGDVKRKTECKKKPSYSANSRIILPIFLEKKNESAQLATFKSEMRRQREGGLERGVKRHFLMPHSSQHPDKQKLHSPIQETNEAIKRETKHTETEKKILTFLPLSL